jgi:hypothetical protein
VCESYARITDLLHTNPSVLAAKTPTAVTATERVPHLLFSAGLVLRSVSVVAHSAMFAYKVVRSRTISDSGCCCIGRNKKRATAATALVSVIEWPGLSA